MSDLNLPPLLACHRQPTPGWKPKTYMADSVEAREGILMARIAKLESALRSLLEQEPEHCPCGDDGCDIGARPWRQARAVMGVGRG